MRTRFCLQNGDDPGSVTEKEHPRFFYQLEKGLLLALKEKEMLDDSQCRSVLEKLSRQYGEQGGDAF